MNPFCWARIARADRDGGRDLAGVGEEAVGPEGVLMVMGDLSFECSDFLLELLICASESIGFKAVDGIPMLDGGNEASGNVPGTFGGDVLGKDADS